MYVKLYHTDFVDGGRQYVVRLLLSELFEG